MKDTIRRRPDPEVIGEAADGEEALELWIGHEIGGGRGMRVALLLATVIATSVFAGCTLLRAGPAGPPEAVIEAGPPEYTGDRSASFSFSSTAPGATFGCSLDGGAFDACASPRAYAGLPDGAHTFRVRATDGGVDGAPAERAWTVDTAAPTVEISAPAGGAAYGVGRAVDAAYRCSDEAGGSGLRSCGGPVADGSPLDTGSVGSKVFTVNAEDRAGNAASLKRTYEVAEKPRVLVGAGDIARCDSTGDEATAALLDNIEGRVFTTGDNVYYDGTGAEFANCYGPSWGRHKARTSPAPGNHEYNTAGAAGYFDYFGAAAGEPGKGYYSYDLGAWHIVVLNSNCAEIGGCGDGSAQLRWLREDLAANAGSCTAAYFHHPRFSSSSYGSDTNVSTFWDALYRAGAELVLNGHSHNYERFAPQDPEGARDRARGVREITVGTGGANFTPLGAPVPNSEVLIADTYGVLALTLRPQGYDWRFVTAPDGAVADAGSGTCH